MCLWPQQMPFCLEKATKTQSQFLFHAASQAPQTSKMLKNERDWTLHLRNWSSMKWSMFTEMTKSNHKQCTLSSKTLSIKTCFLKLRRVNKILYLSKYNKIKYPSSWQCLGRYLHKTCYTFVCNYKATSRFSCDDLQNNSCLYLGKYSIHS
jgi:hypothetical protein